MSAPGIICSGDWTHFRERSSRKTVSFQDASHAPRIVSTAFSVLFSWIQLIKRTDSKYTKCVLLVMYRLYASNSSVSFDYIKYATAPDTFLTILPSASWLGARRSSLRVAECFFQLLFLVSLERESLGAGQNSCRHSHQPGILHTLVQFVIVERS